MKNTYTFLETLNTVINDIMDKKRVYTSLNIRNWPIQYTGRRFSHKDFDNNDLESTFKQTISLYGNASYRILNPTKLLIVLG
jgi:hypothetical protein